MNAPSTAPNLPSPTRASVTHGAALHFETVGPPETGPAPLRIRPDEDTLMRVIGGVVRLTVGDVERVMAPGDEAIVPAAHPHRISGVGGDARYVMGFRAARML
jgi:mannose-6-phosphate isomerase-like protein (cupin superfamily)